MGAPRDGINTLAKELKEGRSKYVYFLLASAGACMGFAVQKLEGMTPGQPLGLGLVAIGAWMLSFTFGCLQVLTHLSMVETNIELLETIGRHGLGQEAHQKNEAYKRRSTVSALLQLLQFFNLAIGVLLFATWRVLLLWHPAHVVPGAH